MSTKFVTLRLGIKKNIIDGLLIHMPLGSNTAMITTKNKFAASPVVVSRNNIKSGTIKYIFINSGNANACTGKEGHMNTKKILNTFFLGRSRGASGEGPELYLAMLTYFSVGHSLGAQFVKGARHA